MDSPQYFAAQPARQTADELMKRATSFFVKGQSNGYLTLLKKLWCAYYGLNPGMNGGDSHEVKFVGEQGELTYINVNHFRNLAQHMNIMITASRPTMEAQAINTDYKSLAQATLANGILQYYMRQKKLEDCIKRAVEMSIVLGSSYIKLEWNATDGELYEIDAESQESTYEGDLEFTNLSPFDVIFDGTKESWKHDWMMVRTWKNKYSLMAKYPEYADKIKMLQTKSDQSVYRFGLFSNDETDDIPVYEFFHKKTEALPEGRYLLYLSPEVVLLDTKLPYRQIPIFRIVPNEILGTPYGYTPLMDLYPIQEAINTTYSNILSNQNAFGVQNIFVKRGSDIALSSIAGGLNIMEGNEAPEAVNLTQTPEEIFKFLDMLIKSAEVISGVNSVARGAPEASLKSGTALALVQSMALQFISGLQQSYVQLVEDVGTSLINILQDFAATPRVVAIVGKNNKPYLKEFTSDEISNISRVIVTLANPMSKSTAGKIQMAEQLLQMGLLTTPEQYFQVLNTGSLDAATEGTTSQLLLIKKENEKMLEGNVPLVSPLDQHQLHIKEHNANVLNDPDLREDPNLVRTVMEHIQQHMDALRNTDPQLLMVIGQQPLPPMPGIMNGMPMDGQPQEEGAPPPGAEGGMAPMQQNQGSVDNGGTPVGPNGQGVNMPKQPTPPPPFENLPTDPSQMGPL